MATSGCEPTTVYVRRNADSPLRLWLFFGLTCVGALVTVTLIRNQIHEAPPVETLESSLAAVNELSWQQLGRHAFVHHQKLRTTFLDDAANETSDEAGGAAGATEAAEDEGAYEGHLVSKPTDLTPAYSFQSASIGRAVRRNQSTFAFGQSLFSNAR